MNGRSPERIVVAGVLAACAGAVLWVGVAALSVPGLLAAVVATVAAASGTWWLSARLPVALDGLAGRRRGLCALWLVLSALALGQTARLSIFMADPSRPQQSLLPWDDWLVRHSCLTAYTEAARLAQSG